MPIDSWKTHILNPDAPVDATTLQETADCILRLFAIHLAHTVNFIELIDVPVNGEHLAMALRCTSSRKKWITGWYGALSQAKSALAREGKGADGAL